MHQPLPYGYFGPDGLAHEDRAFADKLMRHVTNIRQVGQLDSFRMTKALPGGGSVIALDMGGVRKVIATAPPRDRADAEEPGSEVTSAVPMLFSGVVKKARLRSGDKTVIEITRQTQKRLSGYGAKVQDSERYDASARQELERFTIPLSMRFHELMPNDPGDQVITQYEDLRPSWYSGLMATVVQIVGGYGKSEFDKKPKNKTETAELRIPQNVRSRIIQELNGYRLFGCTGKPPKDGGIRYDYKHSECHGVVRGSDRALWLVRVNRQGVYAMPLPMVPATTTKAFREWVEKVGDDELLWCIDNLGGLPSGESFPASPGAFKAWERAGVISRVCGMGDFYDRSAFSSASGWSFNKAGTTAYNTCYDYDESEGLAFGMLYQMNISIGGITPPPDKPAPSPSDTPALKYIAEYVGGLRKAAKANADEGPAVMYKVSIATFSELRTRAMAGRSGESDFDYWKNLELPKIASHQGWVAEDSRGWLNTNSGFESQPQIKFPEPMVKGCVSFDFRPLVLGRFKQVKCDTPMYAFFAPDDELHIIKYFFDPAVTKTKVDGDFEECMTVGTWRQVVSAGGGLQGNFYSNTIDDRKALSGKSTTTVKGTDLGYSQRPAHTPVYTWAMTGKMTRYRYYARKVTTTRTNESMNIAVCIPFYARGAALFARRDWLGYVETAESVSRQSVRDPNEYEFYTIHPREAFYRTPSSDWWRDRVAPQPKDGEPIYGLLVREEGGPCADFADNGPWAGTGITSLSGQIGPVTDGWGAGRSDQAPPCNEYNTLTYNTPDPTGTVKFSGRYGASVIHTNLPDIRYFVNSPSPVTGMFLKFVVYNVAGNSEYVAASEATGQAKQWFRGHTRMADNSGMHHFIGVINE